MFLSYRWYSARNIGICTVEHLHTMWTVLRVEASHGQTGDHDKQANGYQDGGHQVFTLEPAARGKFEETRWWNDEDQRCGAQNALNGRREAGKIKQTLNIHK